MQLTERDERRFWSKVALPNKEGCMLWSGYKSREGYGSFWLADRQRLAHRVSYVIAYGEIPAGLQVDHLCRVRHCVAPGHLEAVTPAENTRRSDAGQNNARKTHCPHGHEYTPENTYTHPKSGRICRACQRRRAADHYATVRAVDGALVIQHTLGPVAGIVQVLPVINEEKA